MSPVRYSASRSSLGARVPSSVSAGWPIRRSAAGFTSTRLTVHVEGEHRHVDRAHHALQQLGGLDRFGPLPLQRVAERVDLLHHEIDGAARLASRCRGWNSPLRAARPAGWPAERARASPSGYATTAQPIHTAADDRRQRPAHFEAVLQGPGDVDERPALTAARRPAPAAGRCARGCGGARAPAAVGRGRAYSRTPYCCSRR